MKLPQNFDAKLPKTKIYEIVQNFDTLHQRGPVPSRPPTSYAYGGNLLQMALKQLFKKKLQVLSSCWGFRPQTLKPP